MKIIGSLAFVRTMIAIAWSAFRSPFSTTVIDVSTGERGKNGSFLIKYFTIDGK